MNLYKLEPNKIIELAFVVRAIRNRSYSAPSLFYCMRYIPSTLVFAEPRVNVATEFLTLHANLSAAHKNSYGGETARTYDDFSS